MLSSAIHSLQLRTVALLVGLLPCVLHAGEIDGVRFEDKINAAGGELVLNGVGLRKAVFNTKVYAAGLYLPRATRDGNQALRPEVVKVVVVVFRRSIEQGRVAEAFRSGILRSAGGSASALARELASLTAWMPAFSQDQRMTVTFAPATGVQIRATGKESVFGASPAFGTALFGMWIGPRPVDEELRAALLGK